jgi:hypothetical protein
MKPTILIIISIILIIFNFFGLASHSRIKLRYKQVLDGVSLRINNNTDRNVNEKDEFVESHRGVYTKLKDIEIGNIQLKSSKALGGARKSNITDNDNETSFEKENNKLTLNNDTYTHYIIATPDPKDYIIEGGKKLENVKYVPSISPAGKKALELSESGE